MSSLLWMPEERTLILGYEDELNMSVSGLFGSIGKFFSNVCKTCGRLLEAGGKLLSQIPLVGPIFSAAFKIVSAPFTALSAIIAGERIDRALIGAIKNTISAVRELVPYVKTVLSLIPGIGSGVSLAISTGLALADGVPIDKAVLDGVKGMLPGGPLAQAAFNLTIAAVQGKNLIQAGLGEALRLVPLAAKTALDGVVNGVINAAGKVIPKDALNALTKALPIDAHKALSVGMAMGQAINIQGATAAAVMKFGPPELNQMVSQGEAVFRGNVTFQQSSVLVADATNRTASDDRIRGLKACIGLASNQGLTETYVSQIRNKLNIEQKKGWDFGSMLHIGAVEAKPVSGPPVKKLGYYTAAGMVDAAPHQKALIVSWIAKHPDMKAGALVAAATVESQLIGSPEEILTRLTAFAERLERGDSNALMTYSSIQTEAGSGNTRAVKLLQMIATARAANAAAPQSATLSVHLEESSPTLWDELLDRLRELLYG